tara:strand:- start:2637 stop:3539 length:903 start_codon:yes stop_codon:yes gene_type:complete
MKFIKQDLIIASRSSSLALKQCKIFKEYLKNINTSVLKIVTTGDKIIDKQLHELGGKGLFVKGLENALLDNKADVAVHSMKDMEWSIAKGTRVAAVLPRGSRRDLLIGKYKSFDEIPIGATIGTSSVRRKAFLLNKRPDLKIHPIRGNVNTRLSKLHNNDFDAIILAEAGIQRLNIKVNSFVLPESILISSAAQGAIAIQAKEEDTELHEFLSAINDPITEKETLAERSFVKSLNGNCSSPIAASAVIKDQSIKLIGAIASEDGKVVIKDSLTDHVKNAVKLGEKLAKTILSKVNRNERF